MKYVGSKWWKFDFHTHTPASMDYGRGDKLLCSSLSPKEWLLKFIDKGIECVAVTDHNTGEWINELKNIAEELRGEGHTIYIFPGVEITANSNVHILAIFDPSKSSIDIDAIIGAAKFRGTRGDSDAVAEESSEVIIEEIKKSGGVAIPAHIDMKAGLCQQPSSHTIRQICEKASAVEVIYPHKEYVEAPLSRYRNLNFSLPEVIGSDSHHPNEVGRAFTWVKMGEPSIDGLRLALVDGSSSIRRFDNTDSDPNQTSSTLLHSITVSNAKYAGRVNPLKVEFNPWLNSIIGGRGSGKSSVLEFIRLGMDRSRDLVELDSTNEIKQSFLNFKKKSGDRDSDGVMLNNTEISCIYSKQNIYYQLTWKYIDENIAISRWDGNIWQTDYGDAGSRFPIKIFSQKQIFNLAKNPTTLLKLIDESTCVNFHDWKMQWEDKKNLFLRLCEQRRELNTKLANKNTLIGQLSDIEQKIVAIESSGHKNILSAYQEANSKSTVISTYLKNIVNSKELIKSQVTNSIYPTFNESSFNKSITSESEIIDRLKDITILFEYMKVDFIQVIAEFEGKIEDFNKWYLSSSFCQTTDNNSKKYQELVSTLSEKGVNNPAEYQQLLHQRTTISTNISQLELIEKEVVNITSSINITYGELIELRIILTTSRHQFIRENIEGNGSIKIELEPLSNKEDIEYSFRKIIGRMDGSFSSDILDREKNMGILHSLLDTISSTNFDLNDEYGLNQRMDLIHKFKGELINFKSGTIFNNSLGKRFFDFLSQLTPQTFDLLNIWFPDDNLILKYHDGNRYKDIAQGSAGQKASAILSFLLSYGSEPLVLDQPEDDLDNGLITSLIVKKLQENKANRQIIVVTHNPNIVVNGDSEYVIALQDKGQIEVKAAGALQEPMIRKNVCNIMEGGELALQQRYKRMFNV